MAVAEDAASVLEQFVQDVANLPAEIAHLLEEIEAKDKTAAECRSAIGQRDVSIQKFCKTSGASAPNPKEEGYNKTVFASFDKAQALQEEKIALAEKSSILLDRQIKRLDLQIRSLENSGILPPDPLLPSILHNSPGNRLPPLSNSTTGASTPLAPIPGNASSIPSNSITNATIQRLVAAQPPQPRHSSPVASGTPGTSTPPASANTSSSTLARSQRESSLDAAKRRRLNAPATSSGLRQSSLGPSATPKASTPTGSIRGGSAGPRGAPSKKLAKTGSNLAPPGKATAKKSSRKKGRKGVAGLKASMSDTGEDSALSEDPGSENEGKGTPRAGGVGDITMGGMDEDDGEDGEGDGDDRKYCTCQNVSYGNMVACDNDDCPYEWFHWSCVGMTKEPSGKWYCEECTKKLGLKG